MRLMIQAFKTEKKKGKKRNKSYCYLYAHVYR